MAYQEIPPSTSGSGSADAWFDDEVEALQLLAPTLTRYEYVKVPYAANASPGVVVSAEGGAQGVASDTVYLHQVPTTVWTAPRTVPWAVSFRAKFTAIAASKTQLVGIAAANIAIAGVGWSHAASTTKWWLYVSGGSAVVSTANADTNIHTVRLACDLTTITGVIDGVTIATSTEVSTLTNSACDPASFSSLSISPGVIVSRLIYGYVDPV